MPLREFNLFGLYCTDTRGPNVASSRLNYKLSCGKSADCTSDFPRSNCRSIFPIYYPEYDLIETSPCSVLQSWSVSDCSWDLLSEWMWMWCARSHIFCSASTHSTAKPSPLIRRPWKCFRLIPAEYTQNRHTWTQWALESRRQLRPPSPQCIGSRRKHQKIDFTPCVLMRNVLCVKSTLIKTSEHWREWIRPY